MTSKKPIVKTTERTIVGVQKYVNPDTGEIQEFTVVDKDISKDTNFHKIWLQDMLNVLDSFGNKKILVLSYLLKIMRNEDNTFSGSYRDFSEECKVSVPTIGVVMNELIESNVIKKVRSCTYQFNPDIVAKGNADKRRNLLIRYNYVDDDNKQIMNARQMTIDDAIRRTEIGYSGTVVEEAEE